MTDGLKQLLIRTRVAATGIRLLAGLRRRDPCAVIIRYHAILPQADPARAFLPPMITHTPEDLRGHLRVLRRHFRIIALGDLLDLVESGAPIPPRSVALTFDDGYTDNYLHAAPVLDEFGARAGFFLTTRLIGTRKLPWFCQTLWAFSRTQVREWTEPVFGRRWSLDSAESRNEARRTANLVFAALTEAEREEHMNVLFESLAVEPPVPDLPLMMNWDQAKALVDAGHVVDSHTVTHPNMALLSLAAVRYEAEQSKQDLQRYLGVGGRVLCYPNPYGEPIHDSLTREVLKASGYRSALLTRSGTISKGADPLTLPRIPTPADEDLFLVTLERQFARL